LSAIDSRFREFESQHGPQQEADEVTPASQDLAADLIDDLLFNDLHTAGFTAGRTGGFPFNLGVLGFPNPMMTPAQATHPSRDRNDPSPQSAFIRTMTPTERHTSPEAAERSWGSEVEMPRLGDTESLSVEMGKYAPTINIQPPTDSRAGGKSTRAPSGLSNVSNVGERTAVPTRVDVVITEERFDPPQNMYQVNEHTYEYVQTPPKGTKITAAELNRDLPALPSDTIKSDRPSPSPQVISLPRKDSPAPVLQQSTQRSPPSSHEIQRPPVLGPAIGQDEHHSPVGHMSVDQPTRNGHSRFLPTDESGHESPIKDTIRLVERAASPYRPQPWDIVTQRLYSWALVWEEETFVRALENISLGQQVGSLM
jgi:hypothetical protein